MNSTKLFVQLLIMVMIMILFISCSSPKDVWEGRIEKVDGITIVRNPQEPYYGEFVIELDDDLEIGNDEDANYQFYRVMGIALDSEQNIYVLDSGNQRIQKFDEDGDYLLTIGRKGEGPGEFMRLSSVFIDDKDTMYLSDRRRIQIFDKAGVYKDIFQSRNHKRWLPL